MDIHCRILDRALCWNGRSDWLLHCFDVRLHGDWGRSLPLQNGGKEQSDSDNKQQWTLKKVAVIISSSKYFTVTVIIRSSEHLKVKVTISSTEHLKMTVTISSTEHFKMTVNISSTKYFTVTVTTMLLSRQCYQYVYWRLVSCELLNSLSECSPQFACRTLVCCRFRQGVQNCIK